MLFIGQITSATDVAVVAAGQTNKLLHAIVAGPTWPLSWT